MRGQSTNTHTLLATQKLCSFPGTCLYRHNWKTENILFPSLEKYKLQFKKKWTITKKKEWKFPPKVQRIGLSEDAHPFQPVLSWFVGCQHPGQSPTSNPGGRGVAHRRKGRDAISSQGTGPAGTEEGHWRVLEAAACHRHLMSPVTGVPTCSLRTFWAMKYLLLSKPEFNANLFVSRWTCCLCFF